VRAEGAELADKERVMPERYAVGDRVRVMDRSASHRREPFKSYIIEGRTATVVRVNNVVSERAPEGQDEIDIRFDDDGTVLKRFIPASLDLGL
jgi:glutamine synthetase